MILYLPDAPVEEMLILGVNKFLLDCKRRKTMKSYLYLTTAIAEMLIGGNVWAQCVSTQDCATLGYTETSCPNGGVKCPFGDKWFCNSGDEKICEKYGFKYDCTNANDVGGIGGTCNGKYSICECASKYNWVDGACTMLNGAVGDLYYCNGVVRGIKVSGMNFYVAMSNSSSYSFCGLSGTVPSLSQLRLIYQNKSDLDVLFSENGGKKMEGRYWSSDSYYNEDSSWANKTEYGYFDMTTGRSGYTQSYYIDYYRLILTSW